MADLTDFYNYFGDASTDTSADVPVDYSYDWAPDAGSYDEAVAGIDYTPSDYVTFFGDAADPGQYQEYSDSWFPAAVEQSYGDGWAPMSEQSTTGGDAGGTFFGLKQPESASFASVPNSSSDTPWYDSLENGLKKYNNLVSGGVGALAFLSSAYNARKNAKAQKEALARAEAEKAARAAKTAAWNAPWVATVPRSRNTAVVGPTVADRYGVSRRGSTEVNAPSNYNYFTRNAVHLAGGGLSHVRHSSGGQADKVPAMLSGGEYVFDADAVSALGDGNNEAGALKLDKMRENIRTHKRSAPPNKIPPKAKEPEAYLKGKK